MQKRKSCLKVVEEVERVVDADDSDGGSSSSSDASLFDSKRSSSSNGNNNNTKTRNKRRSVAFGDLVIYEFPNILGDNAGVSEGAPLSIDWKHDTKRVVAVDYYEFLRQSRPRRRRKDLIVPSAARDTL